MPFFIIYIYYAVVIDLYFIEPAFFIFIYNFTCIPYLCFNYSLSLVKKYCFCCIFNTYGRTWVFWKDSFCISFSIKLFFFKNLTIKLVFPTLASPIKITLIKIIFIFTFILVIEIFFF